MSGVRFNGRWWAKYIRGVLLPEVQAYEECVTGRILRSFATVGNEADARAQDLLSSASAGEDSEGAMEWASDEAFNWKSTMGGFYSGTTALLTAGLFHLFEQHAAHVCREAQRGPFDRETRQGTQIGITDFSSWLLKRGIEVGGFNQWDRINPELRDVANVAKHGEGGAASRLRDLRPDLFKPGGMRGPPGVGAVRHPIAGGGIYISEDEFRRYARAVEDFWTWLAEQLDSDQERSHPG